MSAGNGDVPVAGFSMPKSGKKNKQFIADF
jgi:hypothetical protein